MRDQLAAFLRIALLGLLLGTFVALASLGIPVA